MRQIFICLCILVACSLASATSPDISDDILILYQLSPDQENQFKDNDSAMSSFWNIWSENTSVSITWDFIDMRSDNPAYTWNRSTVSPFNGPEDAQMKVRGTYGAKGVYLWTQIYDNSFIDYASYWTNDVVAFFIDTMPSSSIFDSKNWYNPLQWVLTYSTTEIKHGASDISHCIDVRYYDDLIICDPGPCPGDPGYCDYPGNTAYHGLAIEILSVSSSQKVMEWFVPWELCGTADIIPGKKMAFIAGYNDMDSDVQGEFNSLSWQGNCDPYCEPPSAAVWGDVELGPCLGLSDCSANTMQPHTINHHLKNKNVSADGRFFTLKGTMIPRAPKGTGVYLTQSSRIDLQSPGNTIRIAQTR